MKLNDSVIFPSIVAINLYSISFYHFYQYYLEPIRIHYIPIAILFLSALISSTTSYISKDMLKFYSAVLSSSTIVVGLIVWLLFSSYKDIAIFVPLISIPLIYILLEGISCIGSREFN